MPARDGFSIDTTPYSRDWTVEACLKHLEVAGYRQFGLTLRPGFLWPGDMDAEGCAHFRRFLAGHRLRIVSITAPDVDLVSADPSVRNAAIDLLERIIQLGGEIGARGIILGVGRRGLAATIRPEECRERLQVALDRLAQLAERVGSSVWIGNDPMSWEPSAAGLMQLLDELGDDRIGLAYDVAAGWFSGEDLPQALRTVSRRLGLIRLADTRREAFRYRPIGQGSVPLRGLPAVLAEIGHAERPMIEMADDETDASVEAALVDAVAALRAMGFGDLPEPVS